MRPRSPVPRGRPRGLAALLACLLVVLAAAPALAGPGPAEAGGPPASVGTWPLDPVPPVVTPFDPPSDPWGTGHRGVDLLGAVGQPVRSALDGRITFAGPLAGRGVVVVDHGATRTTYEPVTARVAVGDRVRAGSPIGVLELAGSHCFPRACLHWGWLRGETYLDPLLLVGAGPVRLLPLWRDLPPGSGASGPSRSAGGWLPPSLPYAAWAPPLGVDRDVQARGCACW